MVKYKLIKIYPQCPLKLNDIISSENSYSGCKGTYDWITDNPEIAKEFWEEVKELSLLEQAKLRYPIGTKFSNRNILGNKSTGQTVTIINHNYFEIINDNTLKIRPLGTNGDSSWTLCLNGQWAEIVDDFVLPEKWCIMRTIDNDKIITDYINTFSEFNHALFINNRMNPYLFNIKGCSSSGWNNLDFTEITFEQFKKYVLKENDKPKNIIEVPVGLGKNLVLPPQKVVEKDYEILSFKDLHSSRILKLSPNKQYYQDGNMYLPIEKLLPNIKNWKIYSVKRLSDDEIFTIGDIIYKTFPIVEFEIHDKENTILVSSYLGKKYSSGIYNERLENLKKIKKPLFTLFTTEDGVNIFEGDTYFSVNKKYWRVEEPENTCKINYETYHKNQYNFSTKEKAEEYILMNKPLLSLSDVWDNLKVKDRKAVLEFVKNKIK